MPMAQNHEYVNQKSTWRFFFFFLNNRSLGPSTWEYTRGGDHQGILTCSKALQLILGFQEMLTIPWKEVPR